MTALMRPFAKFPSPSRWTILATGVPAGAVAGVALTQGRPAAEKLVTALVQPGGLLWLVLYWMVWASWRQGSASLSRFAIAIWIAYTIAGQQATAVWLVSKLERPYTAIDPLKQEPFDVVIVLGGGTATGPASTSHLTMAGDRVMMAARMYHAKLARRIICTGDVSPDSDESPDPADHTSRILSDVGVPPEVLVRVGGRNTQEEIQEIAQVVARLPAASRVGLLTSAWHLPRATRLAARRGLQVEPIPADFITPRGWAAESFVPQAGHFFLEGLAIKEYLGIAMGR